MTCELSKRKSNAVSKHFQMSAKELQAVSKTTSEMSEVDKWNAGASSQAASVNLLNNQGMMYKGKPAYVLGITGGEGGVTLSLEVDGSLKKVPMKGLVSGFTKETTALSEDWAMQFKSDMDYMWDPKKKADVLASLAVNKPETIYGLVDNIAEYDRAIPAEENAMLDNALSSIVEPLRDIMPKMSVLLQEEATRTGGRIELVGNLGTVYLGTSGKSTDKSLKESFIHELYHAVTSFALDARDPEIAGIRKEIERIRDEFMSNENAQAVLKKSLPDQANADKELKRLLDYFADSKVGLHEFVAYSVTNQGMVNALASMNTKSKEEVYPNRLAKLVGLVRRMFNWLSDKVTKRPEGNDYTQMAWLVDRLVKVNQKQAVQKERGILGRAVDSLDRIDAYTSSRMDGLRKKMAGKAIKQPKTRLGRWASLPANILRATYDENMRIAVGASMSFMGLKGTSTISTVIRQAMESDKFADMAQMFGMLNTFYDTQRESIRRQTRERLKYAFSREIGSKEFYGLNVITDTDYASIANKHELEDLLDGRKLNGKISQVEKELKSKSTGSDYNYYAFQSDLLAEYMVTGEGNVLLLKNAQNIALKLNAADKRKKADPEVTALIDELTSLYAFKKSAKEHKTTLKSILLEENDKGSNQLHGIDEMLYHLQGMKASADKELFGTESDGVSQQIKGYVVDVYDENLDAKVMPLHMEEQLKKEGYVLKHKVNNHPNDRSGEQGFYVNTLPVKQRMHKTGLRYKNTSARGSSVRQSHYRDDSLRAKDLANTDIAKIRNEMYKKVKAVENGTYKGSQEDKKISPRFNSRGEVIDYNYSMDKANKQELLGAEIDTFNIIGSTAASSYDKRKSKEHNEELLKEMAKDSIVNAPRYRGDKILGSKNNRVYLWVGDDSKSGDRQELWGIFPEEGKALFRGTYDTETGEVEKSGFYVREDLLHNTLGYREKSGTELPIVKHLGIESKYKLQVAGVIWDALIKIYKSNILLRMPEVLFINIASNFNTMLAYKVNPVKVLKYKLNAVKDLTDYIQLAKERVPLHFKAESGKATEQEMRQLSIIDNKMNMSSVKDMMDAGFYNQILEDIEGDETGNIVKDWIGNKVSKAPGVVKEGLSWIFLPDTNPVVKFMNTATQYSDFVARYALFNLLVKEKGVKREAAIKTVREVFVNYNNANSPWLEWANQKGAVMFTKYFTNVQKAIMALGKGHPVSFMLYLLGQNYVMDVPDITDSSMFVKDLENLLYNPLNSVASAAMPGGYVMYDSLTK